MKLKLLLSMTLLGGLVHSAPVYKNVPNELHKAIEIFAVERAELKDGALRVVYQKSLVTEMMYSSFLQGMCNEWWLRPAALSKLKLSKIEVLNAIGAQGFAYEGGLSTCTELGNLKGDTAAFIAARTVRCEAGVCRKRD